MAQQEPTPPFALNVARKREVEGRTDIEDNDALKLNTFIIKERPIYFCKKNLKFINYFDDITQK